MELIARSKRWRDAADTGSTAIADMLVAECLAAAAQGDISAYYDLGVAYSTGSHGVACDLIEAHKWFNLAAVGGHEEAALVPRRHLRRDDRARDRRSPAPRARMADRRRTPQAA